jgi:hypothetical protein
LEKRLAQKSSVSEQTNAEWLALCAACSPVTNTQQMTGVLRSRLNWEALVALAEDHGVLAHLAVALDASSAIVSQEIRDRLREAQRVQAIHALRVTAELFQIVSLLKSEGFEIPVMKGPVLSVRAFGDPGRRRYGDLDFLIRHEDALPVTRLMQKAGYQAVVPPESIEAGKVPGQYLFLRPETRSVIEFHSDRTLRYFPRPLPIDDFYVRRTSIVIDGHPIPALAPEDEFILICIHGTKHFWERLLWIADVAALATKPGALDWSRVQTVGNAVGAQRMVHFSLRLAQKLFLIDVPAEMKEANEADPGLEKWCKRVEEWMPAGGNRPPSLATRAAFRIAMNGGGMVGANYLLRLTFSPTEDDWKAGTENRPAGVRDALLRPFRLARKYGKGSD